MKNIDRIKQMDKEELADFLGEDICYRCIEIQPYPSCSGPCQAGIKKWLESEKWGREND